MGLGTIYPCLSCADAFGIVATENATASIHELEDGGIKARRVQGSGYSAEQSCPRIIDLGRRSATHDQNSAIEKRGRVGQPGARLVQLSGGEEGSAARIVNL